ncbi:MAG TPA: hypothetical protein VKE94_00660 [Gemmataceae bacterium]|nr:hypothetical protein [Gemmataceae bacterium]
MDSGTKRGAPANKNAATLTQETSFCKRAREVMEKVQVPMDE